MVLSLMLHGRHTCLEVREYLKKYGERCLSGEDERGVRVVNTVGYHFDSCLSCNEWYKDFLKKKGG